MSSKLIIGNLKMNFVRHEMKFYASELRKRFQVERPVHFLGLALPYIYLEKAAEELGSFVSILAQDVHHMERGAYTSSISAAQLSSIRIYSVIIGHSECREAGQTEEMISRKVRVALLNGLSVIYCCGKDPLAEIKKELYFLNSSSIEKVTIAFEPLSAIGSGRPFLPELAEEQISHIRALAGEMWGEGGKKIKILYGGSVTKENYKEYLNQRSIDGVLVGSASLKIEDIWAMAKNE